MNHEQLKAEKSIDMQLHLLLLGLLLADPECRQRARQMQLCLESTNLEIVIKDILAGKDHFLSRYLADLGVRRIEPETWKEAVLNCVEQRSAMKLCRSIAASLAGPGAANQPQEYLTMLKEATARLQRMLATEGDHAQETSGQTEKQPGR